jgi:hypothetical protein
VLVGSELIATSTSAPYRAMWNTIPRKWTAGSYATTAVAVDTAGQKTSAKITVQLKK